MRNKKTMKKNLIYLLLFAFTLTAVSCNFSGTQPEKIFSTIGLNGNKIPRNFKRAFDEIRGQKKIGNLKIYNAEKNEYKTATAEEYVKSHYAILFDEDIEKIKALVSDVESQPIIDAGLEMFQYADEIYKKDYVRIAKMIDDGISDEEINAEIEKLESTKGVELDKKYNATMDLLMPYADKNGVEYKTYNTPF